MDGFHRNHHAVGGKPWLNLDYQFINREKDAQAADRKQMKINNEQAGLKYDKNYPYEELKAIRMDIRPSDGENSKDNRHGLLHQVSISIQKGHQETRSCRS